MRSPWDPDRTDFEQLLAGLPGYRIDQLWKGLYHEGKAPADIAQLPKSVRQDLQTDFARALVETTRQESASGDTIKQLWSADDGAQVESVLMHYRARSTVCISSQAGCALGCRFCATGQGGLQRNLSVGEILEQVINAQKLAKPRRLSNVVFMGMGEPFANYRRVVTATRRIINDLQIGARKITISTVGLVPQIRQFAKEELQVGLAISLHAANNELRSELVPINRRHPIGELVDASRDFREETGRRISFEWAMIDGVNDRDSDANELARVARRARAHVNLIPLNPTPGWPTVGTPVNRIADFASRLRDEGVNVTIRANQGVDIDAACGQLRANQTETSVAVSPTRRT